MKRWPAAQLLHETHNRAYALLLLKRLVVRFDHHADELFKAGLWFPAQDLFGLGSIADEQVDLGWTVELGVDDDVLFVCLLYTSDAADE